MQFKLLTSFIVLLSALSPAAGSASSLQLVDDRGEPLEESVDVCIVIALERSCTGFTAGEDVPLPRDFDFLTVEGPDHGPVTLAPADLNWQEEGTARAAVPRKAVLQVTGLPEDGATLSLYKVDDPAFRRPALRETLHPGQTLKVPAKRYLLSISGPDFAPDLRERAFEPAEAVQLTLRREGGGSAVLRIQARQGRGRVPVVGSEVVLKTSSLDLPPDEEPQILGKTTTSSSGLALFTGVEASTADASATHPEFLPEHVPALALQPETFTFREVTVQRGGTLEATVTLDGVRLPEARCRLLLYDRVPGADSAPTQVWESAANPSGTCRGERLREGDYFLRVEAPPPRGRDMWLDMPMEIVEGHVERVTAALERVVLEGSILQGTEPASGFRLVLHDQEARKPSARDPDATAIAEADEEGRYQATLWRPGHYYLVVKTPGGAPAMGERVELMVGTQTRDFELASQQIEGRVVDEEQRPVEGAAVTLVWQESEYNRGFTDENGEFLFALTEEAGSAEVRARGDGYFPSDSMEVEVVRGQRPPPLVLVLEEDHGLQGQLVSPRGPVAGGVVMSYRVESFGNPRWLGQVRTDPDGFFEIPRADTGHTRVFFTGPRCPLGTATPPRGASAAEAAWQVTCPPSSVSLELVLHDPDNTPRAGSGILLRREGLAIPRAVLATHLARARLPFVSDASGRLFLAGLEPGTYELYLAEATSPAAVRMGYDRGFLATVQLPPNSTRTVEATLQETIPKEP